MRSSFHTFCHQDFKADSNNPVANLSVSEVARSFPASNKNIDNAQSGVSSLSSISEVELPVTKDFRKNLQIKRNSSIGMSFRSRRFADVMTEISIVNYGGSLRYSITEENLVDLILLKLLFLKDAASSVISASRHVCRHWKQTLKESSVECDLMLRSKVHVPSVIPDYYTISTDFGYAVWVVLTLMFKVLFATHGYILIEVNIMRGRCIFRYFLPMW